MKTWIKGALGLAAAIFVVLVLGSAGQSAPEQLVPQGAKPIGSLPAEVGGVLDTGKLQKGAPVPDCASVEAVQWFTLTAPRRGPMVARLVARGDLDAAVAVYRIVRSQRFPLVCASGDRHGRARVAWYAYAEGSYLVGVARRSESASDRYALTVRAADRAPRPPGEPLAPGGVRETVNPVLDSADAWAVPMQRGTTYRLNLVTPWRGGCISYELYGPHATSFGRARPVLVQECGGYALFTPGVDGGGLYSVRVKTAQDAPLDHAYRLEVARAGEDDTAPGIGLVNGQYVAGKLFGKGIDAVDLYRFGVPRENELTTLELAQKPNIGFELLVLDETGKQVGAVREGRGRQVLRMNLPAGRYFAALRTKGADGGRYGLQVRVRDVTATTITVNGSRFVEAPADGIVPLAVQVSSASHGGRVLVEIDHFDPLAGWHYAATVTGDLDSNGAFVTDWTPPSVGHWRARARFVANPYSSYSESDYVRMHVIEPLE